MIKHEVEIMGMFEELLRQDWMTEEDWKEVSATALKESGLSIQELSDQVEVGISKGYPAEKQLKLVKLIFKGLGNTKNN